MSDLKEQLAKLCPRPSSATKAKQWDFYVDGICEHPELFVEYSIDTPLEWQHLIAQWAHETGGFTIMYESGAYRPDVLFNIFGVGHHSAKVTREEAARLCALKGEERDRAIFNRVYGVGNPSKANEFNNHGPDDGYLYRGTGIVQITGKNDHDRLYAGDYSAENIIRAALREWDEKGCAKYACADDCKKVTRLINGGHNGLADRQALLAKAKRIWKDCPDFEGMAGTEPANDDGEALAPAAPAGPKTMAESKTGNTSLAVGGLTGLQSYSTMVKEGSAAVQTATEKGSSVIMALLGNQDFMLAAATLVVGVGGAAFIWWDRRHKLQTHGI